MALSNSFDLTSTAADVIQAALEDLQVVIAGESVDSDDQALALRTLNKLVKQWSNPADGSPGMKVWLRKTVYLFLAEGTREYALGPGGVRAAETYYTTTLDAAEANGQTVLSVASTANMANSDIIGIELDDGSLHWSTVSSFVANDTVTIAAQITAAASSGNRVFYYTPVNSQNYLPFRPLEVLHAMLREYNSDGEAVDAARLDVYSREELPMFEQVANKADMADPTCIFVEPRLTTTRITLDSAAQNVDKLIRMVVLSPADDLDAATDTIAFPPEWFAALEWELAKRIAPAFGKVWTQGHQENWTQATMIARAVNPRGYMGGARVQDADEDPGTL
jgi:hypothetical protein